MNISDFYLKKKQNQKISMITCYDYSFAKIISKSNIDCVLVGDSLAMTMHGHSTTLNVDTDIMALHTSAVARGCNNKFIIGDLPFLSYRKDLTTNMNNVEKLMKAGANAVKLEGVSGNLNLIEHIVDSGVPVMGHIGLTPQSINQIGGFKVQGKTQNQQILIKEQALALQDIGCFSIVLECIPATLALEVTESLDISTVGIGAGKYCDGQVLVLQDMLGMNNEFSPKFLKKYLNAEDLFINSFNNFHNDIASSEFPTEKESYL